MKNKYIIAIRLRGDIRIYEFPNKHDRAMFLDCLARGNKNIDYMMATKE
jgi:hypothetical protein